MSTSMRNLIFLAMITVIGLLACSCRGREARSPTTEHNESVSESPEEEEEEEELEDE